MSNKPTFPEPVNSFLGILTTSIGVISTITGFILLWQGNKTIVTTVTIAIGAISLWILFIHIRFSRKRSTQKEIKHKMKGAYIYKAGLRKWAEVGIVVIPLLAIGYISLGNTDKKEPTHSNIIVVAKFDGPESYGVNNFIVDELKTTIKEYKDINLEVIAADEIITVQQGSEYAQNLGRKLNAKTIIWGWFTVSGESVYVTTHIEMIDVPYIFGMKEYVGNTEETGKLIAPSVEASSFELQTELSENISASALYAVGVILDSDGRHQDAVDLFSGALKSFPADTNEKNFLLSRAKILSDRGLSLNWLKRHDEALKDMNEAITLEPDNLTYYHNRGLIYMMSSQSLDLALEDFTKASKSPHVTQSAMSKYQIGVIYSLKKDYTKALEYLDQAEKEFPDFEMIYQEKGLIYLELGEKELARQNFLKAKDLVNDKTWDSIMDIYIKQTY